MFRLKCITLLIGPLQGHGNETYIWLCFIAQICQRYFTIMKNAFIDGHIPPSCPLDFSRWNFGIFLKWFTRGSEVSTYSCCKQKKHCLCTDKYLFLDILVKISHVWTVVQNELFCIIRKSGLHYLEFLFLFDALCRSCCNVGSERIPVKEVI